MVPTLAAGINCVLRAFQWFSIAENIVVCGIPVFQSPESDPIIHVTCNSAEADGALSTILREARNHNPVPEIPRYCNVNRG